MRFFLFILFLIYFPNCKAQLLSHIYEKYEIEKINEIGKPDTLIIFYEPVKYIWGYRSDYVHNLLFVYKKRGEWKCSILKFERKEKFKITSKSTEVFFTNSYNVFLDSLFFESNIRIDSLNNLQLESLSHGPPFEIKSILNKEKHVLIDFRLFKSCYTKTDPILIMYSMCFTLSSGFDYKVIERIKLKRNERMSKKNYKL